MGVGLPYLGHTQQQLQVHQEIVDISVEHSQLSLAQLEHLLRVGGCDHASLPGPQEPIAGYFHIESQAIKIERQSQASGLAEDSGSLRRVQVGGIQLIPPHLLPESTSPRDPWDVTNMCGRIMAEIAVQTHVLLRSVLLWLSLDSYTTA